MGERPVRPDEPAPSRTALWRAGEVAHARGEFVGQESFMRAGEIRALARRAGIGPGVSVLDLCCGVAGPGRMITAESGCRYLGVDSSAGAVGIARGLAGGLPCRFEQAHVPPLPDDRFDVVLLLETMLAFRDKAPLVEAVAGVLPAGGRFACTVEEGPPLTPVERARMPQADTVWPIGLAELTGLLRAAGLAVTWQEEWTAAHAETATALLRSYEADAAGISAALDSAALADLLRAHRAWADWLGSGRVRKFALVAEKR
ncbi:class I SAM-dependent methyltransferase [Blastococcus sp. KM273129]|uniref:class I SAM-dependent methyltransferase n=1 Tax=Blastococcus sp. KM273129 TaxID=2570315 RepID=UPI001F433318|nr:class I SAM-dependent methyltransferase [Blastococcus sp. KM273129]